MQHYEEDDFHLLQLTSKHEIGRTYLIDLQPGGSFKISDQGEFWSTSGKVLQQGFRKGWSPALDMLSRAPRNYIWSALPSLRNIKRA